MVDVKYLLVLLILIVAVGYYSLSPKTIVNNVAVFDEDSCKELLTRHDPSIADMSFFTSGRETHIDNSLGNTTMKYNLTGDKQVFFVFGDTFEGCGIATASEDLLKGNYVQYKCNKETATNLFIETRSTENYFYANYKVIFEDGLTGKIIYMQPEFMSSFITNVRNRLIDFYGCG